MANWHVEQLRLTAFHNSSKSIEPTNWWSDLIGELPANRLSKPHERVIFESGLFRDGVLNLQINPLKIHWRYTPKEDAPINDTGFVLMQNFEGQREFFQKIMANWFKLDSYPKIDRLAFGATILHPVDSRKDGYMRLNKYLSSVKIDPENSSDFLYQINRPRILNLENIKLQINRLCKWSVLSSSRSIVKITPKGIEQESIEEDKFAVKLELDINSSQYFEGEFDQELSENLFSHLIDLGIEISEKGDIK